MNHTHVTDANSLKDYEAYLEASGMGERHKLYLHGVAVRKLRRKQQHDELSKPVASALFVQESAFMNERKWVYRSVTMSHNLAADSRDWSANINGSLITRDGRKELMVAIDRVLDEEVAVMTKTRMINGVKLQLNPQDMSWENINGEAAWMFYMDGSTWSARRVGSPDIRRHRVEGFSSLMRVVQYVKVDHSTNKWRVSTEYAMPTNAIAKAEVGEA